MRRETDTLSRASLKACDQEELEFETINIIKYLPVSEERLQQIQQHTAADESLQDQGGWPEHMSSVPSIISPYFDMHNELTM